MYKICVFAGTAEGRELVEFLSSQPVQVTACVATEYGKTLLPAADNVTVSARRLTAEEIAGMILETGFDLVIDATHPYAASVTESIFTACHAAGTEYLRLLRSASELSDDIIYVPDTESAAVYLDGTDGNIFLTTGSKELSKYKGIHGFADRVYARVLPMDMSLKACHAVGLRASHIIAMQGPFSEEMNLAMLHAFSASWLVTKDGGEPGGFDAKVSAAHKAGVRLVVIGRPVQKDGVTVSEAIGLLCARFGCAHKPHVDVLGIGPGGRDAMTDEVRQAIRRADCLIGAKRMLEAAASSSQRVYDAIKPTEIADFIMTHCEYHRFAVVMSGDVGFYSGAKKLLPLLDFCEVNLLPGLSSLVYFCARLKTSYEDVFVTSVHGRPHNIVPDVRSHARVFVLAGGENGMQEICRSLAEAGLGNVRISIGERLSYPDEKITQGTAEHLAQDTYESLSVSLIENDCPDVVVTHGLIEDDCPDTVVTHRSIENDCPDTVVTHRSIENDCPDGAVMHGLNENVCPNEAVTHGLNENDCPDTVVTHGLPDHMFQRGGGADGIVPMTKSEIRAVCLSKLQLKENSVCWDVGAGTGSVAIEMALTVKKGQVYAIELKDAAVGLIKQNKEKFAVDNLSIVYGHAPDVCLDLPAPSHVFIGGSSGNMRDIIVLLLKKNPSIRIVATAISLESVAELTACIKEFTWCETEVISMQVAHDKKAGSYHLMTGQNPIYIFTMQAMGKLSVS